MKIFEDEEKWIPMVNNALEIMRQSSNVGNLPTGQLEELERESRRAESELLQGEQEALDAAERRRQKKKDNKDKRSHSGQPTVILVPYNAPHESESEQEVERQLDFEGVATSDVEAKSSHRSVKKLEPNEPQTPEELIARTTEPPVHGVQDVQLIPEPAVEGTDQGNAPVEVDAPEQEQSTGEVGQLEEESQNPPQDGDKPSGEEDKNPDKEK